MVVVQRLLRYLGHCAATVINDVEIRDGSLTVSNIGFGTVSSYKGHGLSTAPNVNIGGGTDPGPGILTAKYIVLK